MITTPVDRTTLPAWLVAGDKYGTIVLLGRPHRVNRDVAEMLLERVAISLEGGCTLEQAERVATEQLIRKHTRRPAA